MRYFVSILVAATLLSAPGCALLCGIPPEAQQTVQEKSDLSDAFVLMMDAGTTTRENEQKFIHSVRRAFHALNYAINDVPLPRDIEIWFKRYKLGLSAEKSNPSSNLAPEPTPEWTSPPR